MISGRNDRLVFGQLKEYLGALARGGGPHSAVLKGVFQGSSFLFYITTWLSLQRQYFLRPVLQDHMQHPTLCPNSWWLTNLIMFLTTFSTFATLSFQSFVPQLNFSGLPNSSSIIISNTSDVDLSAPWYLPYRLLVPWSEIILDFGFGLRRRALSPEHMAGLLFVAEDYCQEQVEHFGVNAVFPVEPGHQQRFHKTLGDGINLQIRNSVPDEFFSWGALTDVIEGLILVVVNRENYRQCYFKFRDGYGILGMGQIAADDSQLPDEVA